MKLSPFIISVFETGDPIYKPGYTFKNDETNTYYTVIHRNRVGSIFSRQHCYVVTVRNATHREITQWYRDTTSALAG